MEGNKDEALRCIEIAMKRIADGNKDGAIKFLNKSIALYPTSKARDLLNFYNSDTNNDNGNKEEEEEEESNSNSNSNSNNNDSSESSTVHKRHSASASASVPSSHEQTSSSASNTSSSSTTESSKPKYTKEQVELIKKIKLCKSYYEVLEVKKTATEVDIKKAYRKLALQMHPDKNHAPGAEEAFKIVTQAFSCLSDPSKRSVYDLHGAESPMSATRGGFGGRRGGGGYYEEELSPEDIFNIFFGIPPRGGGARRNHPFYSDFQPMAGNRGRTFHYQFGGGGNRAAGAQGGQPETSFFTIIMVLFSLLYVVASFFGGGSSSASHNNRPLASLYSFEPRFGLKERHMRLGSEDITIDFSFYVKDNLEGILKYNGIKMDQLENEVKEAWLEVQAKQCRRKEVLEAKGAPQSSAEYQELLKKGAFQHCDLLKKLGYRWYNTN